MKKLDLEAGELSEVAGRRYEVVPDRRAAWSWGPAITPMAELDAEHGWKAASEEDFKRPTADDPGDGEG